MSSKSTRDLYCLRADLIEIRSKYPERQSAGKLLEQFIDLANEEIVESEYMDREKSDSRCR